MAVAVACLFDGQTKSVQPQTENEHSHRAVINDREIEMFPANWHMGAERTEIQKIFQDTWCGVVWAQEMKR